MIANRATCMQQLRQIADATDGMAARDLRAVCEVAERRWVAATVRGAEEPGSLPPAAKYLQAAEARRASLSNEGTEKGSEREQRRALERLAGLYAPPGRTWGRTEE